MQLLHPAATLKLRVWLAAGGVALVLLSSACGGSSKRSGGGEAGEPACSGAECAGGCTYDGKSYARGDTFPATDGCNSCSCDEAGLVACTQRGCPSCESISATYGELMERAERCDPGQPNQCTLRVVAGLGCGCDTFLNPDAFDEAEIRAAVAAYSANDCGGDVLCGECNPAVSARCSAEGRCVTDSDPKDGVGCRVGGVTYQDGAQDVPDPFSCNSCECDDGHLICTEINCPNACPDGAVPDTGCFQCGPTDACLVLETGCFPACTDSCAEGVCLGGVCKSVCG